MKLYRIVRFASMLYAGTVIGNAMNHFYSYVDAKIEIDKGVYGPNLESAWNKYAELQIKRIFDSKVLVPFSSAFSREKRPLEINIKYRGKNGPKLKIDIEDKVKNDNVVI